MSLFAVLGIICTTNGYYIKYKSINSSYGDILFPWLLTMCLGLSLTLITWLSPTNVLLEKIFMPILFFGPIIVLIGYTNVKQENFIQLFKNEAKNIDEGLKKLIYFVLFLIICLILVEFTDYGDNFVLECIFLVLTILIDLIVLRLLSVEIIKKSHRENLIPWISWALASIFFFIYQYDIKGTNVWFSTAPWATLNSLCFSSTIIICHIIAFKNEKKTTSWGRFYFLISDLIFAISFIVWSKVSCFLANPE